MNKYEEKAHKCINRRTQQLGYKKGQKPKYFLLSFLQTLRKQMFQGMWPGKIFLMNLELNIKLLEGPHHMTSLAWPVGVGCIKTSTRLNSCPRVVGQLAEQLTQ